MTLVILHSYYLSLNKRTLGIQKILKSYVYNLMNGEHVQLLSRPALSSMVAAIHMTLFK